MKPILLKLDDDLHRFYKIQAKISWISLSEWIRTQCNVALTLRSRIRTGSDNSDRKDRVHAPRKWRTASRCG
jgi:hypothetical protein